VDRVAAHARVAVERGRELDRNAEPVAARHDQVRAGAPVLAQTPQERAWCEGEDAVSVDQRIDGCSAVIKAARDRSEKLAEAFNNRAIGYRVKGDYDRAIQDYNQAIKLNPKNAGAYVDRALALARRGDGDAAMKDYTMAITLNPQQWQAYFNRAAELRDHGKLHEAVADLNQVVKLNPEFAGAYLNRGNIYVRQGELDKAIADYNAALLRDANLSYVYIVRANLFLRKKNYRKAMSDLQTAVQMDTKKPERALNALAWLRATCPEPGIRDGKEGVELAIKACELSEWKDSGIIDTLAAAYAELGDFDRAIKYQKQVLQMVEPSTDDGKLRQRLALYGKHKPYRETAN